MIEITLLIYSDVYKIMIRKNGLIKLLDRTFTNYKFAENYAKQVAKRNNTNLTFENRTI